MKRLVATLVVFTVLTASGLAAAQITQESPARKLERSTEPSVPITRGPASWHPEFGRSLDSQAVEVALTTHRVTTQLRWL